MVAWPVSTLGTLGSRLAVTRSAPGNFIEGSGVMCRSGFTLTCVDAALLPCTPSLALGSCASGAVIVLFDVHLSVPAGLFGGFVNEGTILAPGPRSHAPR